MSEQAPTVQLRDPGAVGAQQVCPARPELPGLLVETYPHGERIRAVVSGEIDLQTDQLLDNALQAAVSRSHSGVDLDLSGVQFCDCTGLNVLLRLRRHALKDGKTITIRKISPIVMRVLTATRTLPLFTLDRDTSPTMNHPPVPQETQSDEDAEHDLHTEVVQLRRAMQTRPIIDLARGVLMASFRLTPEEAWNVLVAVSQHTNTKLHRLARDVLATIDGQPLPEAVQQHLNAAVAGLDTLPAVPAPSDSKA